MGSPPYKSLWFPMKKAEASANPQKARATLNSLLAHISPTATIGYTDGSVYNLWEVEQARRQLESQEEIY